MSGHGRSCPGGVTWFVPRNMCDRWGYRRGYLASPLVRRRTPEKWAGFAQMASSCALKLRRPLEKGLAALGLSLQIPCQPCEIGNRGPKTGGKIVSFVRGELIDLDVSRCRFQCGEVDF